MTQTVEPTPARSAPGQARRPGSRAASADLVHDLCPLLLADDGAWRRVTAAREHRCAALGPDVPLGVDKQRRLCLRDAHRTCTTYAAAMRLGPSDVDESDLPTSTVRPYPRMTPVVLDTGRIRGAVRRGRPTRTGGQMLLAGLMLAAFGVLALTRLTAGEAGGVAGATSPILAASPSPPATSPATAVPSASTSPIPTAAPSTPAPTVVRTYTVRRGDTLSGIAGEFGTTVKALMELNGITNARQLRVGAVLELP